PVRGRSPRPFGAKERFAYYAARSSQPLPSRSLVPRPWVSFLYLLPGAGHYGKPEVFPVMLPPVTARLQGKRRVERGLALEPADEKWPEAQTEEWLVRS